MQAKLKILIAGVVTAVAALLVATPAQAHERHRHGRHSVDRHRHVRVLVPGRHHADSRFRVPERIQRRDRHRYRPYFSARTYYAPHRHHHVVYDFPVRTRQGLVYRQHRYCDGSLFSGGRVEFHGRRVHFGIEF